MTDDKASRSQGMAKRQRRLFERLIDDLAHKAAYSRYGFFWIAFLSFLENTVLLFAVEPLFIPLMALHPQRTYRIATALLLGSVAGAVVTYGFGYLLFDLYGQAFVALFDSPQHFEQIKTDISDNGFLAIFLIGITPIPFQLGTLGAGVVGYNFAAFIAAVLISRAIRYYAQAVLVRWLGMQAHYWIERNKITFLVLCVIIVAAAMAYAGFLAG